MNIIETKYFNIGKYLQCIYRYWNSSINKSDFFNNLLHVFLADDIPEYELDKASVSKLLAHSYDLTRNVKRIIGVADDSLMHDFVSIIEESVSCPLDILSLTIYNALSQSSEHDSDSASQLRNKYKEGHFMTFLFHAFKHASSMPNTPFKQKAKTGRKPRGSSNSVFYLSEEEKAFERSRIKTKILKSNDRLTRQDFNEMIELMAYASLEFSQEDKKVVAIHFLRNWKKLDERISISEDFLDEMKTAQMTFGEAKKYRFLNWEKPVAEAESTIILLAFPVIFRKAERQNSFADACRMLSLISSIEGVVDSDALKTMLKDNGFFLPDFSGHITHSIWSYCIGIAQLSKRAGLTTDFCNQLDKNYPRLSRNNTISERVETLNRISRGLRTV